MTDTDVLVVGSGVAGSLVAHRLASAGIRVTILEAGPRLRRGEIVERFRNAPDKQRFMAPYPGTKAAPNPSGTKADDYLIQAGPDRYDTQYIRAVGGTTWHWAAAAWRFLPVDFRLRSSHGVGRDWPIDYATIEPFYQRAEAALGVSGPGMGEALGSPRAAPYPMPALPLDYMDAEFQRVLNAGGFTVVPEPVARNSRPYDGRPPCCGNNNCMPICPIAAQYSGSMHAAKAEAAGARLIDSAVAFRIEAGGEGGSVDAVAYRRPDGSDQRITARIVVLAANGIETPKLLLMSAAPARPAGIANSSGLVGRNLMDHPGTGVSFLWGKPVFPGRGPQEMTSVVNLRDGAFRRDFSAKKLHLGNTADLRGVTEALIGRNLSGKALDQAIRARVARQVTINCFHEQLPDPANRIRPSADQRDAIGLPRPEITYRIDDYVRRSAADTHDQYAKIAALLGGEEVVHDDHFANNNHIMGTTIMGADAADAVVDADCRAHDHPNLFVAGSSVFASAACVNSTLTIAALALRLGDHLLGVLGKSV